MNKRRRFLIFLYSKPNLVGSVLGLLGLVLHFAGVIGDFWFPIILGLYAAGVLLTPKDEQTERALKNRMTVRDLQDDLASLERKARRRLPKDAQEKVASIRAVLCEILPTVSDLDSGDYNVYIIRQMAEEYLPQTLQNYLKLPKGYARFHPVKDGKTPHQLLMEQLNLLDSVMKEISQDFFRNDTQGMMVHGRFLEDKFGKDGS
jgi:hypothetical protein